jgi:hypothetical protein
VQGLHASQGWLHGVLSSPLVDLADVLPTVRSNSLTNRKQNFFCPRRLSSLRKEAGIVQPCSTKIRIALRLGFRSYPIDIRPNVVTLVGQSH